MAVLERRPVDPSGMRDRNAALLLRIIWEAHEISRADLARETGMSPSTVSAIVAELQDAGLVRFVRAGASTGGRRPQLVSFCDDAFVLIGIEVGASHMTVVAMDMRGRALADATVKWFARDDAQGTLETMKRVCDDVLATGAVRLRTLVGLGVAMPSPVLPGGAGRLSPMVLPAWREVDLMGELRGHYRVPVFVENDANAGALAEQWWGAGRDGDDLTYIKLGTGVGAGHIIHGRLHRGAGGTAGEIGHVLVKPDGEQCGCGNRGCLTTLIGTHALIARAIEVGVRTESSEITVLSLIDAARAGEANAVRLIESVARELGLAVASLLNLMNPAIVVIGGDLAQAGDLLIDPLRITVKGRALFTSIANTRVVRTTLGYRATAIGAATMVLDAALSDRTLFTATMGTAA